MVQVARTVPVETSRMLIAKTVVLDSQDRIQRLLELSDSHVLVDALPHSTEPDVGWQ